MVELTPERVLREFELPGAVRLSVYPTEKFKTSFVNIIKTIDNGLNLGFLNITESYSATDIGALSVSQKSRIQIGMVNVTERIDGVQIGLLNFAQNGFLPVFPFFNFPKAEH